METMLTDTEGISLQRKKDCKMVKVNNNSRQILILNRHQNRKRNLFKWIQATSETLMK